MSKISQKDPWLRAERKRRLGTWYSIDSVSLWVGRKQRTRLILILGFFLLLAIVLLSFLSERFEAGDIRIPIATLVLLIFIGALIFASLVLIEVLIYFRSGSLEGPTQRRLITLFVSMALVPTVLVAIISTITLNFGVDSWFSARVRNVVTSSYETARTYALEHEQEFILESDLVFDLYTDKRQSRFATTHREDIEIAVQLSAANIAHSFILDTSGEILGRGPNSYLFNLNLPSKAELEVMRSNVYTVLNRPKRNELVYLRSLPETSEGGSTQYLYLVREIDGEIFDLLSQSEKTVEFYKESEQTRQTLLLSYGLFYLTISIIILLIAIWAGMFFSGRLTRPIGKLVKAAQKISDGDLNSRVIDSGDNDEFSLLSRTFNQMAIDVQDNQAKLKHAVSVSDSEKRRFNKVLEGVSSGVMGVDGKGRVNFINSAAISLLKIKNDDTNLNIADIAPEFTEAWQKIRESEEGIVQEQITLIREGQQDTIYLRVTPSDRRKTGNTIISFDVVSDLVQAQRMAAWGDVARRIAHEIKNPLTPIRLSAERLNKRFAKQIDDDREKFSDLTHIIVRQTQDIQHIVDEFARFSRMPKAAKIENDWIESIQQAITLQQQNPLNIDISYEGPKRADGLFDQGQIGQALTNLIKNAIESVEMQIGKQELSEGDSQIKGQISVKATKQRDILEIEIIDNGVGFPADKVRLFEPYMTLKETGTGLGLPIVKKIIEDHDGKIMLHDRDDNQHGARIIIRVPTTMTLSE